MKDAKKRNSMGNIKIGLTNQVTMGGNAGFGTLIDEGTLLLINHIRRRRV